MANTNLMSISLNQATASTGVKYSSSSRGNGSDFNSALGRATNTINRQAAPAQQNPTNPDAVKNTNSNEQKPDAPVEQQTTTNNTTTQGENTQPQDAPQSLPQNQATSKNVPAEVDAKTVLNDAKVQPENVLPNVEIQPENILPNTKIKTIETEIIDVPEINPEMSYVFAVNAEALLQPQQITEEKSGEVNLMAIMPQNDSNKAQSMLDILSGKTWTAEDVKATVAVQNSNVVEINPESLPVNQNQNSNNFTLNPNSQSENPQPQIFTRQANLAPAQPMNLNPEQQPQIQTQLNTEQQPQIQQMNLNSEQQPQFQTQLNTEQPLQAQTQIQSQVQQAPLQQTLQTQITMQEQPILNSLQPQFEPKQINQQNQLTELLGASVQLEENQNTSPLLPVQPLLRQHPENNQQQNTNQNFQQSLSQELNPEVQSQQQNIGGEESFAQNLSPSVDNVTNNQNVAQTQNSEAAAQARENQSIPTQIVEQARLIRTAENTEMVINLKPEHLGQLTLRISVSQNGAVNASFYSDNVQVRVAIENSIVQLKQELNDQGLKVENVQVYAGLSDGGLTNGQGGQAWQQQQQRSNGGRKIDFNALQEEVDSVNPANDIEAADGVDYKI